jgi:two-component system, LuxR family, response regulator FixJ
MKGNSSVAKPIVYVIDDDAAVGDSFHVMLESNGFEVRSYTSAAMFLAETPPLERSCLLVDVNMPELDGIELLARLRRGGVMIPAVLVTGGKITTSLVSTADQSGVALLEKPIMAQELVAEIYKALGRDGHADR